MPTRFIKVGSAFINPWATAAASDTDIDEGWCAVTLNSGKVIMVDAPLGEVVDAIEVACADEILEPDNTPLLSPVGFAR